GQLQAKQKELTERQRALLAKEQQLRTQMAGFRTDIRQKVTQANSYESIYYLIGQQLYVADKLLASKEPLDQQQALSLAVEAGQHALQGAEQAWLGARIYEAYLLPNLHLADDKGRVGYTPEALLNYCNKMFEQLEEIPNVIRVQRMALVRALTNAPARADASRYSLGYALERAGNYDEALSCYRAVEDTNYLHFAEKRIAIVHTLKDQQRAKRN
ncbi:MAG: hypothetical protein NTW03_07745, partial [Verrucomicrobia bacterium]|nr:hypothetical protein [Verrucomicrobiota bacterium]